MNKSLKQKLLGKLSPEESTLVQWLVDEVGIRQDDPLYPFLIVLHHYQTLLSTVPQQLERSADTALNKALTVYGTMQSQLEASSTQMQQQLAVANQQMQQGNATTTQQFSAVQASNQQLTQAVEKLHTAQQQLAKTFKQKLNKTEAIAANTAQTERQQWVQAAVFVGIIFACAGAAYWAGMQAKAQAVEQAQGQTLEYTSQFWQWNNDRLSRCQKDNNPKCTFLIAPPTKEKQP